ncbi:hypothetical protein KAR91_36275 [Candidatus Pacearchaeota archaeon]|nr:hypothetical protein [Candidatus Pacearchaeota archaeon]
MKKSIEFHKKTLKNREASLEIKKTELARLQKDVAEFSIANAKLDMQINIAVQRGKENFDRDRFLKTKNT